MMFGFASKKMGLDLMELKEISVIACLAKGAGDKDDVLKFFCHDFSKNVSYREYLPELQFVHRIKMLNGDVEVPTKVARSLLNTGQPTEAKLISNMNMDPDEQYCRIFWQHQDERGLLCLSYRIEGTDAPFKWQWHLEAAQFSSILKFYRYLLKHVQHKAACLSQNQQMLLEVIKKKDMEIAQCRLDSGQPTVVSDSFDVEAFNEQNKHLLTAVTAAPTVSRKRKAEDAIFDGSDSDDLTDNEVDEESQISELSYETNSVFEIEAIVLMEDDTSSDDMNSDDA